MGWKRVVSDLYSLSPLRSLKIDPILSDFRVSFAEDRSIQCTGYTLDGTDKPIMVLDKYDTSSQGDTHLLSWVQKTVLIALTK
jgi:hypothetical protein